MDSLERARSEYMAELDEQVEQLEQLCRDMYANMRKTIGTMSAEDADAFDENWTARMDALGLLEVD